VKEQEKLRLYAALARKHYLERKLARLDRLIAKLGAREAPATSHQPLATEVYHE
jgi:hypothetical protein